MKSAFLKWYEDQYGRRNTKWQKRSDQELQGLQLKALDYEAELRRRRYWDIRKDAALKAWQAGEKQK